MKWTEAVLVARLQARLYGERMRVEKRGGYWQTMTADRCIVSPAGWHMPVDRQRSPHRAPGWLR